jgi:hypothetical protein
MDLDVIDLARRGGGWGIKINTAGGLQAKNSLANKLPAGRGIDPSFDGPINSVTLAIGRLSR